MPSSKKKLSFSLSRPKVKKIFRSIKSPFRNDDRVKDGPAATPVVDQHVQDSLREDYEELGVDKKTVIHHREQIPPASSDDESSTWLSDQESDSSSGSEIYFDAQETILDPSDRDIAVRDDETEFVSNMITQHNQAYILRQGKEKDMTNNDTGLDQQQQHDAHLTLQKLSPELIIEIMLLLPHSSLYLLQQTCQKFRQLSKRDTFKTFNLEFRSGPESYCISENGYQQRKVIRDIFARRTLCQECNDNRDSGKLKEAMQKLYELQYCHGCKASHPALFFGPGEKEKQYAQCLGRIGNFPLCSHVSLAGPDMVTLANTGGEDETIECDDLSHKLSPYLYEKTDTPHVYLSNAGTWTDGPMKYNLRFAFRSTLHLVVLDGCSNKHTEEAIRQFKSGSYAEFDTKALCKHFSSEILDECIAPGPSKCSCFPRSDGRSIECGLLKATPSATCKTCKARYHLSLQQDWRLLSIPGSVPGTIAKSKKRAQTMVDLKIDREFWVKTFLQPSWLFNLTYNHDEECDPRLKRNPLFNEEMKHVLWCTNPGCATGSERRWERMALLYLNDAFNKEELEDGGSANKNHARDMAWLSFEYDVFNDLTT
ncbi:hypothetical protein H9Q69_004377 [Fusarium xylarioides]|nr:hypothetical protein H9Q70_002056 [Fusarium xylarioides]KAG5784906.1 hypothetical protein H9Q73_001456 [Fusarium xylarioides]KAG5796551.1 hypothetical protein H9Q69_004377 [Fusarium xylarioides]KAG5803428.1 hypothetical protein H9Q71_011994 [Fusarium xylarioides]KAG5816763.1 hypothetical protein H9Q74_010955 [Fusarium xylarioides]